jgi:hypothetical protein
MGCFVGGAAKDVGQATATTRMFLSTSPKQQVKKAAKSSNIGVRTPFQSVIGAFSQQVADSGKPNFTGAWGMMWSRTLSFCCTSFCLAIALSFASLNLPAIFACFSSFFSVFGSAVTLLEIVQATTEQKSQCSCFGCEGGFVSIATKATMVASRFPPNKCPHCRFVSFRLGFALSSRFHPLSQRSR